MDNKTNIWTELIGFLGLVNNDTGVQGKSFIFRINIEEDQFEAILFVHPTVKPFVTTEDDRFDPELLLKLILIKYKLEDLIAYEDK